MARDGGSVARGGRPIARAPSGASHRRRGARVGRRRVARATGCTGPAGGGSHVCAGGGVRRSWRASHRFGRAPRRVAAGRRAESPVCHENTGTDLPTIEWYGESRPRVCSLRGLGGRQIRPLNSIAREILSHNTPNGTSRVARRPAPGGGRAPRCTKRRTTGMKEHTS